MSTLLKAAVGVAAAVISVGICFKIMKKNERNESDVVAKEDPTSISPTIDDLYTLFTDYNIPKTLICIIVEYARTETGYFISLEVKSSKEIVATSMQCNLSLVPFGKVTFGHKKELHAKRLLIGPHPANWRRCLVVAEHFVPAWNRSLYLVNRNIFLLGQYFILFSRNSVISFQPLKDLTLRRVSKTRIFPEKGNNRFDQSVILPYGINCFWISHRNMIWRIELGVQTNGVVILKNKPIKIIHCLYSEWFVDTVSGNRINVSVDNEGERYNFYSLKDDDHQLRHIRVRHQAFHDAIFISSYHVVTIRNMNAITLETQIIDFRTSESKNDYQWSFDLPFSIDTRIRLFQMHNRIYFFSSPSTYILSKDATEWIQVDPHSSFAGFKASTAKDGKCTCFLPPVCDPSTQ